MPFYPKSVTNRVEEVDFLRGIAIVFMVIFHWYVLYDLRHGTSTLGHPVLTVLGFVARVLFIFLVGVATALAQQKAQLREDNGEQDEREFLRRQYRRVGYLALYALLVTLVTAWVYPDVYVRFGILHYMAVALALLTLFAQAANDWQDATPRCGTRDVLCTTASRTRCRTTMPRNYNGVLATLWDDGHFPLFKWFYYRSACMWASPCSRGATDLHITGGGRERWGRRICWGSTIGDLFDTLCGDLWRAADDGMSGEYTKP